MPDRTQTLSVELTREEIEHLISRVEMEPAVESEGVARRGHACFSGPVRTPLGDKLRAALSKAEKE